MEAPAQQHLAHATETDESASTLTLTESAAEMARAAMAREGASGQALRVSVVGGGCSGFQYSLAFDAATHADDVITEQHGVRVVVDNTSLQYLRGVTIDYVHGLHGAGFKFVNPNATRTCGCGTSFSA